MKIVGLVACCGPKLAHRAPAGLLYTSDLFRKSVAYLLARDVDEWAILSAKHGLVLPNETIAPYDLSLTSMPATKRKEWARKVQHQLEVQGYYPEGTHFVVLGGRHYLEPFRNLQGYSYEDPLEGMQIGERLRFLKEAVEGGS